LDLRLGIDETSWITGKTQIPLNRSAMQQSYRLN
jgi:hypothetical protein